MSFATAGDSSRPVISPIIQSAAGAVPDTRSRAPGSGGVASSIPPPKPRACPWPLMCGAQSRRRRPLVSAGLCLIWWRFVGGLEEGGGPGGLERSHTQRIHRAFRSAFGCRCGRILRGRFVLPGSSLLKLLVIWSSFYFYKGKHISRVRVECILNFTDYKVWNFYLSK